MKNPHMKSLISSSSRGVLAYVFAQALSFGAMAATASHGVSVSDAWIRATVPGQTASGAFMRITSQEAASLVGFTSHLANTHQLHEMRMEGDVMRMREVAQVSLPAGKPVVLGPGGLHLMLIDLQKPLNAGETAPLTLLVQLSNGQQVRVTTQARIERRSPYATTPAAPSSGGMPMH
jgi:periplasmic copper chaperone A